MTDPMPKFRTLFKAQSALTRIELRAKTTQAVYVAVALVFGFLAFAMLNLAAYLALKDVVGPVWAGVLMGVGDALLAAMLAKTAAGVKPGPEVDAARDFRDLVWDELSHDAERVKGEIEGVRDQIKAVTSGVSRVGGLIPGVSSVVDLITRSLKKKKQ